MKYRNYDFMFTSFQSFLMIDIFLGVLCQKLRLWQLNLSWRNCVKFQHQSIADSSLQAQVSRNTLRKSKLSIKGG